MRLQRLRSVYTDKLFYFLVVSLSVLLFLVVIFCLKIYGRTLSEPAKKHAAALTFLNPVNKRSDTSSFNHQTKKALTNLSAMSTDGAFLWSNAFNFKKTIDAQTDPRTGMLSAHIKVGGLLSNEGHGPDIDLEA
ncbi:MAG: hypothetical protein OXD32_03120, partial [Endozoicomonadaceae bacterium]|nr:hypothetical protein [Endozoicomonadaceae bacterium]